MSACRSSDRGRGLVVVILAAALSLTSLPGATLCVASDGHVAIEARGSDCAPGGDAAGAPAASLHSCTDTALGAPSLTQREGDACQIVTAALWALPAFATPCLARAHHSQPAGAPPGAPQRSLSNVLLL